IILTGGVSAGDADYVPEALTTAGFVCHFHKVAIKPGKPIWFGTHPNGCIAFGLPGNPFSVQVGVKVFVETLLLQSFAPNTTPYITMPLADSRQKANKLDEFLPCWFGP